MKLIWKREFQDRGAPHWHLWTVPPGDNLREFMDWLSLTWTTSMQVPREFGPGHFADRPGYRCVCSEWCRSIGAGTGVDFAEGLRASDPKRLAVYFLKESAGGDAKAYQNSVPWLWCHGGLDTRATHPSTPVVGQLGPFPEKKIPRGSVGRFWGVKGLQPAVSSALVEMDCSYRIWRIMRNVRRSRSMAVVREVEKVDSRTGEIHLVKHIKRPRIRGTAGWVSVNDGASFGFRLAEFARLLNGDRPVSRPFWARDLAPEKASRLFELRQKYDIVPLANVVYERVPPVCRRGRERCRCAVCYPAKLAELEKQGMPWEA